MSQTAIPLSAMPRRISCWTSPARGSSPRRRAASQSQLWEPRPTYWRGNDSSLQSKAEFDRVAVNSGQRAVVARRPAPGPGPAADLQEQRAEHGPRAPGVDQHDGRARRRDVPDRHRAVQQLHAGPAAGEPGHPGVGELRLPGRHEQRQPRADRLVGHRPGQAREAARDGGQRDAVLLRRQHVGDAGQLGRQDRRPDRGRPAERGADVLLRQAGDGAVPGQRRLAGPRVDRQRGQQRHVQHDRRGRALAVGHELHPDRHRRRHRHGELLPADPAGGDAGDRRRGHRHVEPGAARGAAAARRSPASTSTATRTCRRSSTAPSTRTASRSTWPARATTPAGTGR